ncbi:MAG: histidine kinase dimerization/phospho-acceptor domain-containing protein, partial [Haliea sp.]
MHGELRQRRGGWREQVLRGAACRLQLDVESRSLCRQRLDENLACFRRDALCLRCLALSQAELFNATARFAELADGSSIPDGGQAGTLTQIENAYDNLPAFGETGEFLLGRIDEGGAIEVLMSERQASRGNDAAVAAAGLSTALERAIAGEYGVVQAEDYRGQQVLAAFAPAGEPGMGVIMKTDMAEINAPFFRTSLISATTAIVLILASYLIFRRVSAPILVSLERKVEEQEQLVRKRTREIEKARNEIADQLAFQQALLEAIPNPVFYLGPDARYLGINEAYEQLFGVSSDDCVGKTVLEMDSIVIAGKEKLLAEDRDIIENGTFIQREISRDAHDGSTRELILSKVGFRKLDGSPGGLLGTYVDITEQKETARQLEIARDAAEEATRLKANFLASMSHEIRTPMNGIVGMVELLLQAEENTDKRQLLKTIAISADTLLTIINDILDFSKIEAGKMELESIPFRIQEVVEEVALSLQQL